MSTEIGRRSAVSLAAAISSIVVLAIASSAGSSPTELVCGGDKFSQVAITSEPFGGSRTPEEALAAVQQIPGFPKEAASVHSTDGPDRIVRTDEGDDPGSGATYLILVDDQLVVKVGINRQQSGLFIAGSWTSCE